MGFFLQMGTVSTKRCHHVLWKANLEVSTHVSHGSFLTDTILDLR